jgi:hypothetical protein
VKIVKRILSGIAVLVLFTGPVIYNHYRLQHSELVIEEFPDSAQYQNRENSEPNDSVSWIQEHALWIQVSVLGLVGIGCVVILRLWAAQRRIRAFEVRIGASGLTRHRHRRRHRGLVMIIVALTMLVAIATAAAFWIVEPGTAAVGTTSYGLPEAFNQPQLTPADAGKNQRDIDELIRRSKEGHPAKFF